MEELTDILIEVDRTLFREAYLPWIALPDNIVGVAANFEWDVNPAGLPFFTDMRFTD